MMDFFSPEYSIIFCRAYFCHFGKICPKIRNKQAKLMDFCSSENSIVFSVLN